MFLISSSVDCPSDLAVVTVSKVLRLMLEGGSDAPLSLLYGWFIVEFHYRPHAAD